MNQPLTADEERETDLLKEQLAIEQYRNTLLLATLKLAQDSYIDSADLDAKLDDFIADLTGPRKAEVIEELRQIEAAREDAHIGAESRAYQDGLGVTTP